MQKLLFSIGFILLLILSIDGTLNEVHATVFLDGHPVEIESCESTSSTIQMTDSIYIDVVGDTSDSSSNSGGAKGNSYWATIEVELTEAEFWLDFSDTQTLTYYVFDCPDEFGTYNEVYRASESVTGVGAGWYSSGPLSITLGVDMHYIIAVSWTGSMTYYYGSNDTVPTSFGFYTHGYAIGYDPLPASFESLTNDQATYYQRLTTDHPTALQMTTWGAIKAGYTE